MNSKLYPYTIIFYACYRDQWRGNPLSFRCMAETSGDAIAQFNAAQPEGYLRSISVQLV